MGLLVKRTTDEAFQPLGEKKVLNKYSWLLLCCCQEASEWVLGVCNNKNCCDLAGEVIKQWGRVPFIPGPQPPPYKVSRSDILYCDSFGTLALHLAHLQPKNNRIT